MQVATSGTDVEAQLLLSKDRLTGYHVKGRANGDRDLVGRYLHNVAVSQALYPYFHAVEVILRNKIHEAVSRDRPIDPDRLDLYNDFPCWLDATDTVLTLDHQAEVAAAKWGVMKDLRRRFGDRASQSRHLRTPGRLVAKLPFSFWVYLFDSDYVASERANDSILWPRYTAAVFPHRSQPGIVDVRRTLRRLHVVRNRIMHYERIAPWDNYDRTALRPDHVKNDILQLLEWMAPRVAEILRHHGPGDYYFGRAFGRYLRAIAGPP